MAGANCFGVIVDAPAAPNNVIALPSVHGARVQQPALGQPMMAHAGFAGLMVLDIHIPQSRSLKDKRQSLRSVMTRVRDAGFSASEVDHHDKWQRAQVAVSIVGRGSSNVEQLLDTALRVFESRPELDVAVRQRTVLAIDEYGE